MIDAATMKAKAHANAPAIIDQYRVGQLRDALDRIETAANGGKHGVNVEFHTTTKDLCMSSNAKTFQMLLTDELIDRGFHVVASAVNAGTLWVYWG